MTARLTLYWLVAALAIGPAHAATPHPGNRGPAHVEVVAGANGATLRVDGQDFFIKGAGLDDGDPATVAGHGGNAIRTWRSDHGDAVLDRARRAGVFVALGLDVARERHGFDYNDPLAVAAQRERVRAQVVRYKDHPALLMWLVGNELNLGSHNPKVWDAVNQIAEMIHQLDPNHPVSTPLAGFVPEVVAQVQARAPALDLLSFQVYGDIDTLPARLDAFGWTAPYLITEWGPTGHWESPTTDWGAAIEADGNDKAATLMARYQRVIAGDHGRCLGAFVFLWGQKQERTPTWYGLFLDSGENTPSVDAMQQLWTGAWPRNRSPALASLRLDGRTALTSLHLRPGAEVTASAPATDPDGDRLRWQWQLRLESTAQSIGGDAEPLPPRVSMSPARRHGSDLQFRAPARPGAYRLFVIVRDGRGHASYANFPFYVDAEAATP